MSQLDTSPESVWDACFHLGISIERVGTSLFNVLHQHVNATKLHMNLLLGEWEGVMDGFSLLGNHLFIIFIVLIFPLFLNLGASSYTMGGLGLILLVIHTLFENSHIFIPVLVDSPISFLAVTTTLFYGLADVMQKLKEQPVEGVDKNKRVITELAEMINLVWCLVNTHPKVFLFLTLILTMKSLTRGFVLMMMLMGAIKMNSVGWHLKNARSPRYIELAPHPINK
eukprot:m.416743 g.416743  ORF g.416743 m.416743 type:complete len:226 (+) comp30089_c0_seq1:77-754(+)